MAHLWIYLAAYAAVAVAVFIGYAISQAMTGSPVMPAHAFSAALWPLPLLGLIWWLLSGVRLPRSRA